MRIASLLLVVVSFVPGTLRAQSSVPEAALAAESAGQWDTAIAVYRAVLEREPLRVDLWVRMADIEARRGDTNACIRALEQAVAHERNTPALYERLSQAYATAGRASDGLRAIESALALRPKDPTYLKARATLATWTGDYRSAEASYRTLARLDPADVGLSLLHARVSAWAGDTDEAVREYRRYLTAKPTEATAWLELSRAERWRGNFRGALNALRTYKTRFGTNASYDGEMAAVLAGAGRPHAAEHVLTSLLSNAPTNYELLLTQTLALAEQRRAHDAFASLAAAKDLAPDRPETGSTARVLRTLLASSAEAPFTVYSDSDALRIARFVPHATIALQSGTAFGAGYERDQLQALAGSGLNALNGAATVWYEQTFASVAQRFGAVTLSGQAGDARAEDQVHHTYAVSVETRLADSLRFSLSQAFAPFVVSPRTVSLGITATTDRVQFDWTPTITTHLALDGAYYELSDGNRRWEVTISPRLTAARTSHLNVDLGMSVYRLETAHDLADGYYDPRRYESYAATVYPYIKIRENIGVGLSLAAGVQRGTESPFFQFGGNATVESTIGIYQAWALKLSASGTLNQRLTSGAYRGFGTAATLIRRF
jgi:tetratricopeptide (TPR) repeat protein